MGKNRQDQTFSNCNIQFVSFYHKLIQLQSNQLQRIEVKYILKQPQTLSNFSIQFFLLLS